MFAKFIKVFITAVVLLLCGMIVLRCCASADRSTLTELYVTPELADAYADGELEVLELEDNASEIAADGYFAAYGFRYIPECRQLQATVRVNVSIYGYLDLPEDSRLDFYLCRGDDVTTLRAPDVTLDESKSIYRYKKLVWNDVDLGDADWQVYLDLQDGTYSTTALRYALQEFDDYDLTRAEKKALRGE